MISFIVAMADNGTIGKDGKIPWHLPGELDYFKQTTMGHPIIMGRKTHESIGRALSGRYNTVITRQDNYQAEDCAVVPSLERAIEAAKKAPGSNEIFVIGGAEIYKLAMPLANRIYLTKVHADVEGDKFFKYDPKDWQEISRESFGADEQNRYDYDVIVLKRMPASAPLA